MDRDRRRSPSCLLRRFGAFSLCLLPAPACALPLNPVQEETSHALPAPARPPAAYTVTSRSVEGREICCFVFGTGKETVLVFGGFHGDEEAGVRLCHRLCTELRRRPTLLRGKRILVVPVLNPDGRAKHRRTNARGVDLNRNFDTPNRRPGPEAGPFPLSEPETRFAYALIRAFRPACIVSIHQPLGCVDWDGPAMGPAAVISSACGLPVKKLGARPGSLGSYGGVMLGLPTLTIELPGTAADASDNELWARYGKALASIR